MENLIKYILDVALNTNLWLKRLTKIEEDEIFYVYINYNTMEFQNL